MSNLSTLQALIAGFLIAVVATVVLGLLINWTVAPIVVLVGAIAFLFFIGGRSRSGSTAG